VLSSETLPACDDEDDEDHLNSPPACSRMESWRRYPEGLEALEKDGIRAKGRLAGEVR
jgi:hypothetical protein